MANIHVVAGDGNGSWDLIFHIPIPNTNNSVGVNWRTALVNSGLGGTTQLPDGDGSAGTISAAEKAGLVAGALFEHRERFLLESGGSSGAQTQALIRSLYTREKSRAQADLQRKLKYFGHTESES